MKPINKSVKLTLCPETLRALTASELSNAIGGRMNTSEGGGKCPTMDINKCNVESRAVC